MNLHSRIDRLQEFRATVADQQLVAEAALIYEDPAIEGPACRLFLDVDRLPFSVAGTVVTYELEIVDVTAQQSCCEVVVV